MRISQPPLLHVFPGDDFELWLMFVDEAEQPIPITGYRYTLALARQLNQPVPDFVFDVPELTGEGPAQGVTHLHLAADTTRRFLPVTYWMELRQHRNGMVETLFQARLKVRGPNRMH